MLHLVGKGNKLATMPVTAPVLRVLEAAAASGPAGRWCYYWEPIATCRAGRHRGGVKKTMMADKAGLIRGTLQLSHFDSEFLHRDLLRPGGRPGYWRSAGCWSISGARRCISKCGSSSSG